MADESLDQATPEPAPTYQELTEALSDLKDEVDLYGNIFDQLGHLFSAMRDGHPARTKSLSQIGHYLGEDWAGTAHFVSEKAG